MTTMLDQISRITKIGGSESLDELFRDKGGNNRFNVSPVEADRQMKQKLQQRDNQSQKGITHG